MTASSPEGDPEPPVTTGGEERASRFVAEAAHQLRTPVAGIRACAEALLGGVPEEEQGVLLSRIVRETSRAVELISDLLRIVQLDEGIALEPTPCDVVALCADECDRLYSLAPAVDVVFGVTAAFEPPPVLDARALREIVANLLDNARRHARQRIDVEAGPVDGMVEIKVTDDGPGIPAELVDRAFERFASLDDMGGSGLGLPIARSLARAQGGDLTYENKAFVLRLPATPATGTGELSATHPPTR